MSRHSPWFLRVSRSFAQSTLYLFTSNSEVVDQDPFFSIWMGHLLPVVNFATGCQGQSRAAVLTQTDIRVIAFASGQSPTLPSVAIPKPRFVFWGDGNRMLLRSTFAYLVCKVHLLVSALLFRQLLVWEYGCFSAMTNQSTGVSVSLSGWLLVRGTGA